MTGILELYYVDKDDPETVQVGRGCDFTSYELRPWGLVVVHSQGNTIVPWHRIRKMIVR